MIGFEVIINKKSLVGGIQEGITSVIVDRLLLDARNELTISFGGYDTKTNNSIHWLKKELFIGNRITIKVIEVMDNISIPFEIESYRETNSKLTSNISLWLFVKGEVIHANIAKGSIHLIATVLNEKNKSEIELDFIIVEYIDNEDTPKKHCYKNTLVLGDALTIEVKE